MPLDNFWYFSPLFQLFSLTLVLFLFSTQIAGSYHDYGDNEVHHSGVEESACLLSRWTFAWVSPVVWKAFSASLTGADLYLLAWNNRASVTAQRFSAAAPIASTLLSKLYRWSRSDLAYQGAWATVYSVTSLCPAILLRIILSYMAAPETSSRSDAWLSVGGLLLFGLASGIADCQCEWSGRKVSLRLRAILIDEIFTKILRRRVVMSEVTPQEPEHAASDATEGAVMNLMAADAASISEVGAHMHLVWINFPLQLIISTLVLYNLLGFSGLLGVLMMILLLPLNVLVSKRQVAAQAKTLSAADDRIQANNELISNIRIIKLCTLEAVFREKVRSLRQTELSALRGRFLWWSVSMTVFYSLPFVTTIVTLFLYTIVERKSLTTEVAFPALAIFAILRIPLDRMPAMISFMLQAHVSIGRVERFLGEQELTRHDHVSNITDCPAGFNNASLQWTATGSDDLTTEDDIELAELTTRPSFRLSNMKIDFRPHELNVILGASGCGKSSLLLALLGEMQLLYGQVNLPLEPEFRHPIQSPESVEELPRTAVAYCSQQPWILNTSIRANILFGLPFRSQRYNSVLDAVALTLDLAAFEERDLTVAGERGTRLSGGQRQRVALARALYSNTQYLILDDCLSALDSRTAKHVFFHGIMGPLAEGRTCILATHNGQLALPHCQHAVLLEDGQVKAQGTASYMKHREVDVEHDSDHGHLRTTSIAVKADPDKIASEMTPQLPLPSSLHEVDETTAKEAYVEDISSGAVPLSVVKTYLSSMGKLWFWVAILIAFAVQQLSSLGTNFWIKTWAHRFDTRDPQSATVSSVYYLTIYGTICLGYVGISFARDLTALSGALKASSRIFDNLLDSILHADLVFFDKVPFGQIANRFSRDISAIDQEVALHSLSTFYTLCSVAAAIVLISALLPIFLPAAAIICVVSYFISNVYISGARDLKRLEAVRQSPLYQHFGEALLGCVSIRAYGHAARFTDDNRELIDSFNKPYYLLWAAKEWLTFRVAWALTKEQSAQLVQLYAIVQQSFNSVERVDEYTKITPEPTEPLKRPIYDLSPEWPARGHVRINRYSTKYSTYGDLVLADVDFEIPAGKRVAVVGRTGAGKSTLALALIRAVEATSGEIVIDGINVASVTLTRLRQAVSVVPQDPTLFDGTLRDNLDPWHSHSDAQLIETLHEVQFFRSLPLGSLDDPASILSLGQRQLVCIARALLRRSRLLILDEATASIDHATDALVQLGLRSSGGGSKCIDHCPPHQINYRLRSRGRSGQRQSR